MAPCALGVNVAGSTNATFQMGTVVQYAKIMVAVIFAVVQRIPFQVQYSMATMNKGRHRARPPQGEKVVNLQMQIWYSKPSHPSRPEA